MVISPDHVTTTTQQIDHHVRSGGEQGTAAAIPPGFNG